MNMLWALYIHTYKYGYICLFPIDIGVEGQKPKFFARNCMECGDLHRKSCCKSPPLWGEIGLGLKYQSIFVMN